MDKFGVIGSSKKENERRVPIHPDHLSRIPDHLRSRLVFEEGYGAHFGVPDSEFVANAGGVAPRSELLADLGFVVPPKPGLDELETLRVGGILWEWPHCVQ